MSRKVCRWILFTSNTEQSMSIYHYMLKHISCVEILIPGQMNSDIRNLFIFIIILKIS